MVKFSDLVDIKKTESVTKKEPGPELKEKRGVIKGRFKIRKSDDDKMLAFGWANVAVTSGGQQIEDYDEDMIDTEELEKAAYNFVEFYREGGEKHERGGCAVLVESMIFTKEKMDVLGVTEGTLPEGWWIGFKVTDRTSGTRSRCVPHVFY